MLKIAQGTIANSVCIVYSLRRFSFKSRTQGTLYIWEQDIQGIHLQVSTKAQEERTLAVETHSPESNFRPPRTRPYDLQ